jgi:hypothetical protein
MYVIKIENENPFDAGWHACHMGLKYDAAVKQLWPNGTDAHTLEVFRGGFEMREQTADMEDERQINRHGMAHIAFLVQATNEFPAIKHVRSRVTIEEV